MRPSTSAPRRSRGKAQIRDFFATKAGPFQPGNHWVSDTPAYKVRITANGDKGTLYFECHYIDVKTGKVVSVVAADQNVQKINGKWLITSAAAGSPHWALSLADDVIRRARPVIRAATYGRERRADNWLVRAVGRVPVKVRTKLLVAFAVIAALLVAVGGRSVCACSASRMLGSSRSARCSCVRRRTGACRPRRRQLRQLLAIRVAEEPDLNTYLERQRVRRPQAAQSWTLVDKTILRRVSQLGPATNEDALRVRAAAARTSCCSGGSGPTTGGSRER